MHALDTEYEVTITELSNKNDPAKYTEALRRVCTLRTAEELSYVLHHIRPFSDCPAYNLNLFRQGVSASWEHPANTAGCSWIAQFRTEVSNILFERLCAYFCLTGFRRFSCNGIKINIRKGFVKFSIWSAGVPSVVDCSSVMEELQTAFGLDFEIDFSYKSHKELLEKVVSPKDA